MDLSGAGSLCFDEEFFRKKRLLFQAYKVSAGGEVDGLGAYKTYDVRGRVIFFVVTTALGLLKVSLGPGFLTLNSSKARGK